MIHTKIQQIPGAPPGQVSVHLDGTPIPSLREVQVTFEANSCARLKLNVNFPIVAPIEMPMDVKAFIHVPIGGMLETEELGNGKRRFTVVKREK